MLPLQLRRTGHRDAVSSHLRPQDVAAAGWLLDPAAFGHRLSAGHYEIPPWIDYVSRYVALKMAKGNARILISVPPQHGKSNLFSGWLPVWRQELHPGRKIGVISYSATLAARWVRFGRDSVIENQDKLRIKIGKAAEDYWECMVPGQPAGYVRAMGITGSITGFGFEDLVLDDLYASPEEAFSESYRAKVEDAYWAVIEGRLAENANVIGIMTRWHHDDLFGKLIRSGDYEEIRMPALAEEGDVLGRKVGEALWEKKHSRTKLEKRRAGMPPHIWAAQYAARPLFQTGSFFRSEWFHVVQARPALVTSRIRYWDPAASKKQKAGDPDWCVGTLMSIIRGSGTAEDGRYCVEDVERARGSPLEIERLILATAQRDGRHVPIRIEQEPGSEAVLYLAYLKKVLAGWDVREVKHGSDKKARAKPWAAQMEIGNVVWVNGPWLEEARREHLVFTGEDNQHHDDIVDACTGAFGELAGSKKWPWWELGRGRFDPERAAERRNILGAERFDRDAFKRTLDMCAPESSTRGIMTRGDL
jgi:predicted phage terminase large subunit-like protein